VRRWTELRSYAALDLLIASNREQVDTVTALRRRPPTVAYVPNGVAPLPPARYAGFLTRYGVPAGADVVGNVGRLAPEKRQDVFLEACARIVAERPATHAVLLGDGRERQALERLARRLGIADRVHFAGLVEDVPAACAELTLLLHTSDTEGTPRAVVEAMAAGVPVIATAVGGVPDLVDDGRTGVLTQRGDAAALAREAVRLLDQPATRREMGERGRRRAEALFSATTMARRVEDLYRGCLTRPARAVA
jgi:glycosyltransferase involved in cell wall biosynthesis